MDDDENYLTVTCPNCDEEIGDGLSFADAFERSDTGQELRCVCESCGKSSYWHVDGLKLEHAGTSSNGLVERFIWFCKSLYR